MCQSLGSIYQGAKHVGPWFFLEPWPSGPRRQLPSGERRGVGVHATLWAQLQPRLAELRARLEQKPQPVFLTGGKLGKGRGGVGCGGGGVRTGSGLMWLLMFSPLKKRTTTIKQYIFGGVKTFLGLIDVGRLRESVVFTSRKC